MKIIGISRVFVKRCIQIGTFFQKYLKNTPVSQLYIEGDTSWELIHIIIHQISSSMKQREIMEQITPNLEPQAAHVVTIHTLNKEQDGDKMFARLGGGRKKSDPENPWWGDVKLKKIYGGLLLGTSYKSHVAGAAVRSGATDSKSEVEVKTKQSWHTFENRFFEKDRATGEKFYLKIQSSKSTFESSPFVSITETYIIKGVEYTRKQAEEILKGYLKPIKETKPTSTQIEAGVTDDNEIKYYLPNVDDIVEIKQGKYHYCKK